MGHHPTPVRCEFNVNGICVHDYGKRSGVMALLGNKQCVYNVYTIAQKECKYYVPISKPVLAPPGYRSMPSVKEPLQPDNIPRSLDKISERNILLKQVAAVTEKKKPLFNHIECNNGTCGMVITGNVGSCQLCLVKITYDDN